MLLTVKSNLQQIKMGIIKQGKAKGKEREEEERAKQHGAMSTCASGEAWRCTAS